MRGLLVLACLTLMTLVSSETPAPPNDRVLYSAVDTLTLYPGRLTAARRRDPIPQASCMANKRLCDLATVKLLRCHKDGHSFDPESIQWYCQAIMPVEFTLGFIEIDCEGYDSTEDAWVLRGSCGVKFGLHLSEAGHRRYGDDGIWIDRDGKLSGWSKWLLLVVGCGIASLATVLLCVKDQKKESVEIRQNGSSRHSERDPLLANGVRDYGGTETA